MILRLFSEMPHLQIKHFSQMDVNDLFRLTEHGLKVFRGVNGFVNAVNTENDQQLVARIQRITRSHFDRGIIAKEDFEVLCGQKEVHVTKVRFFTGGL